jgi:hypothetical protein
LTIVFIFAVMELDAPGRDPALMQGLEAAKARVEAMRKESG